MKTQNENEVERESQRLALKYASTKIKQEYQDALKRAGITTRHYLQALGLRPEMYKPFVKALADLDFYKWADVSQDLGISIEGIKERQEDDSVFSLDKILDTGDKVLIAPHRTFERVDQGQFLTGFNPKTGKFTFSTEPKYSGHSQLKGRTLQEENIVEGGFTRVLPIQKRIELYGMSDTFQVYPREISFNLLSRALPDWIVRERR